MPLTKQWNKHNQLWVGCNSNIVCCKIIFSQSSLLQLLQPFYGSLDFLRDYLGEPVPER